jgi:hypothetical protein
MAMQQESVKAAGDVVSLMTVVGTLAEILPAIAALLTIVWTGFRIYETETVQKWIGKNNVQKD